MGTVLGGLVHFHPLDSDTSDGVFLLFPRLLFFKYCRLHAQSIPDSLSFREFRICSLLATAIFFGPYWRDVSATFDDRFYFYFRMQPLQGLEWKVNSRHFSKPTLLSSSSKLEFSHFSRNIRSRRKGSCIYPGYHRVVTFTLLIKLDERTNISGQM